MGNHDSLAMQQAKLLGIVSAALDFARHNPELFLEHARKEISPEFNAMTVREVRRDSERAYRHITHVMRQFLFLPQNEDVAAKILGMAMDISEKETGNPLPPPGDMQ